MYSGAHNKHQPLTLVEEIHWEETMNAKPIKSSMEELTNGSMGVRLTPNPSQGYAENHTWLNVRATLTILQEEKLGAVHFSKGVWKKLESKWFHNESLSFIMGINL